MTHLYAPRPLLSVLGLLAVSGLLGLLAAPAPASASTSPVVLNELNCTRTDWIEVMNRGDAEVSIGNWLLTDDALDRVPLRPSHRWRFPAGTTLAPGARVVVTGSGSGFPFGLSCGDDVLRLADASDTPVDSYALPVLASGDETLGRIPDGTGDWTVTMPTPGAANAVAAATPATDPAWLYDPLQMTQIDLEAAPDALAQLAADPGEYVAARITLHHGGDTYGPYAVGIKLKGHASFRTLDGKASFKVKFGFAVSGQRFFGLKGLTLNNMVQDPSMIAEAGSSLLAQAAGVPSARVGYAYVTLNGAEYGLYADVETVDAVMAQRWFAGTQHLYEADYGSDVGPGRAGEFQVDEGSSADVSDLDALGAADAAGPDGWWQRLQAVADTSELTRAFAVEHYVGQWDGYSFGTTPSQPNNYYLHRDLAGRFSLLPSGTDQTWLERTPFGAYGNGLLMRHCAVDPSCNAAYIGALRGLAGSPAVAAVAAEARAIRDAIAPWRLRDPRREQSVAEGEAQADAKIATMEARPAELAAWLADPTFVDLLAGPAALDAGVGAGAGGGGQQPSTPAAVSVVPSTVAAPATLQTAAAPPVAMRLLLGKPVVSPAKAVAGRLFTFTLPVTRSDTHEAPLTGKTTCKPTLAGKALKHTDSFAKGKARLSLVLPATAKGKLLRIAVTVTASGRRTEGTFTYTVR
jgi:hypothetical protein